jgi:hypothetical protein
MSAERAQSKARRNYLESEQVEDEQSTAATNSGSSRTIVIAICFIVPTPLPTADGFTLPFAIVPCGLTIRSAIAGAELGSNCEEFPSALLMIRTDAFHFNPLGRIEELNRTSVIRV